MASNGRGSPSQSAPRGIPGSHQSQNNYLSASPGQGSYARSSSIARLGSPVRSQHISTSGQQTPAIGNDGTNDERPSNEPLAGLEGGKSSSLQPGESALAAALKEARGASPQRFGTPPTGTRSPAQIAAEGKGPAGNYGSFEPRSGTPVPYQDPDIVRRHLVGPSDASSAYSSPARGTGNGLLGHKKSQQDVVAEDEEFSSLKLQGGDITRQIYKWSEQQDAERQGRVRRTRSFHSERPRPDDHSLNIETIKQPGGFRRNYIRRVGASPSPGPSMRNGPNDPQPGRQKPEMFTSNFIEFLSLYGHFAGESLDEDDELLGPDEYFSSDWEDSTGQREDEEECGETSALLTPGAKKRKRKEKAAGKGSALGASMLLLKSFVGTGVLFLPRAFLNGGMLFSNVVLVGVAGLSYYAFVLLVTTRLAVEHSFGDMGLVLYGKWMRNLINFSLVISQIGFSSAYIVFVSENLQAFILAVSNCRTYINIGYMILMQMIIFLPLSLYRNINNIQKLALVADVFIVLGLVYLYYYDIFTLVDNHGIADIKLFNAKDWTLFIGTAIFTFEGIGLIIPIQTGMENPKKFPNVLGTVMIIISVIFISMGALSYAAYGSATKTVIILNLPQDNKLVNGVQFIYSLAILLSTPLQIYPAIEITSQQLFSKTGKYNPYIKWKKNVFRFFMVALCAAIAWAGSNDLDKFVAIVGSFACVPLVFIYPPMLHYRAVSKTTFKKACDVILIIFGFIVMIYTTTLTIKGWVDGDSSKSPGYCDERRKNLLFP